MTVSIETVDNTDAFLCLEKDWKAFEKKTGHSLVTMSYDWLKSYWVTLGDVENDLFGYDKRLCIVLVREKSEILAIAPFITVSRIKKILKKAVKIRCIEFLGQQWAGTYSDIISMPERSYLPEILDFLNQDTNYGFDIIKLSYIPAFSANFKNYADNLHSFSLISEIPLKRSYEDIRENIYSVNLKKNIKKYENKIRKSGLPIRYEIISGISGLKTIYGDVKRISSSKNISQMGSTLEDPDKERFFREALINNPDAYCTAFYDDKQCIAYNMGIVYNNAVYALDGSYDRNYTNKMNISFGSLVIDRTVHYFSGSLYSLSLGPGGDSYKFHFSKNYTLLKNFIFPGPTLKSKLYYPFIRQRNKRLERDINLFLGNIV